MGKELKLRPNLWTQKEESSGQFPLPQLLIPVTRARSAQHLFYVSTLAVPLTDVWVSDLVSGLAKASLRTK